MAPDIFKPWTPVFNGLENLGRVNMTLIEALARGEFGQAWEEAKREWRLVTLEAGLGLLAAAVGCGLAAAPDQKQPDLPLKTDHRVGDTVDSKLFGQDKVFFSG